MPPQDHSIPVGITARHVHLSRGHLDVLFGPGYQLTPVMPITQTGEQACAETVTLRGPGGSIEHVRIIGPVRERSQVEVTLRDQARLGIASSLHLSSRLEGSPGCTLEGPAGTVVLAEGLLNALRHLHLSANEARRLNLSDAMVVSVAIGSDRARVLHDVVIHLQNETPSALHLDPEEAAAADVGPETKAWILPSKGA